MPVRKQMTTHLAFKIVMTQLRRLKNVDAIIVEAKII